MLVFFAFVHQFSGETFVEWRFFPDILGRNGAMATFRWDFCQNPSSRELPNKREPDPARSAGGAVFIGTGAVFQLAYETGDLSVVRLYGPAAEGRRLRMAVVMMPSSGSTIRYSQGDVHLA